MVVSDQSSGQLYKMSMSGMGGHWSSDANGNPYVQNKNVGIGTNAPQSSLHIDNPSGSDVTITTENSKCNTMMVDHDCGWSWRCRNYNYNYKLMQHYNSSHGPDEKYNG